MFVLVAAFIAVHELAHWIYSRAIYGSAGAITCNAYACTTVVATNDPLNPAFAFTATILAGAVIAVVSRHVAPMLNIATAGFMISTILYMFEWLTPWAVGDGLKMYEAFGPLPAVILSVPAIAVAIHGFRGISNEL